MNIFKFVVKKSGYDLFLNDKLILSEVCDRAKTENIKNFLISISGPCNCAVSVIEETKNKSKYDDSIPSTNYFIKKESYRNPERCPECGEYNCDPDGIGHYRG